MTKKFKKYLSISLIAFLMLYNTMLPRLVFAEEITPAPAENSSTSSEPSATVDNSSAVTNSSTTDSNTGSNSINAGPTPTPSANPDTSSSPTPSPSPAPDSNTLSSPPPSPSPSPAPDSSGSVTATNSATVNNNSSSIAISGDNSITASGTAILNETAPATESAQTSSDSSNQSNGNINTGDAVSVTSLQNNINTTSLNSEVVYQTLNLFVSETGNLNISDPFSIAASVIPEHPNDSVINVSVTNVNNYAYLSNEVVSYANTGGNSINSSNTATASAVINTGDAYSLVSLLNKVNFTIINSKIHIISINIFGNLNGNIVLPNLSLFSSSNCDTCGISLLASNAAVLENNVNSSAVTGQNSISGLSGSIATGDANSVVNLLNIVNTTFFGTAAQGLYINVLGSWMGNFIGWDALNPQAGGASLVFYQTGPAVSNGSGCSSCTGDASIQNDANVINSISSTANTGTNTINGGNGTITTGNAFSAVSLINLINTNFINSFGFFGFVNIFGNWTGDIGGQAEFEALETPNGEEAPSGEAVLESSAQNSDVREEGGLLEVSQTNNVGAYVLPGDTVTFFVKVKNIGSGKVYETKLKLFLIKDGKIAGGTTFDLGAIPAGRAVNLTTGFVLSKNAPGGQYIARAYVLGEAGANNDKVDASADSTFNVFGTQNLVQALTAGGNNNQPPKAVLGANANSSQRASIARAAEQMLYLSLLMLVIFTYASIRLIRKKEFVFEIISSSSFKEKLVAFRMLLL